MMIGFLNGDDYADAKLDSCIGHSDRGRRGGMLYMDYRNDRFKKYTNSLYTDLCDIGHSAKQCKPGDRFEIRFDFVAKQATAFYNERRLGLIAEALPDTVYPALSMDTWSGEQSVECTKFEIMYK